MFETKLKSKEFFMAPRVPYWMLAVSLGLLLISVTASADTYNFFFPKKGEQGAEQAETQAATAQAATAPAPTPVPAAQNTPTIVNPGNGQQPIIINNNISSSSQPAPSISQPSPNTTTEVLETEPPLTSVTLGVHPSEHASIEMGYSPWRFGFGAFHLADWHQTDGNQSNWGGNVSFGVSFARILGTTAYFGLRRSETERTGVFAGADFEVMPIRFGFEKAKVRYDIFEAGFLVGASTNAHNRHNWATAHLGARANLNLSETFGLTAITRVNLGYLMFETGIIARF